MNKLKLKSKSFTILNDHEVELSHIVADGQFRCTDFYIPETVTIDGKNYDVVGIKLYPSTYDKPACNVDNLYIGKNINKIDFESLEYIMATNVFIDEANEAYVCIDNVIYSKDKTYLYSGNYFKNDVLKLPKEVQVIYDCAFLNNLYLRELYAYDNLRELRSNAFYNCKSLEIVSLDTCKASYDLGVFKGCCNLKKVRLPDTATLFNDNPKYKGHNIIWLDKIIFDNTTKTVLGTTDRYLEDLILPEDTLTVGYDAFQYNKFIKTVTCNSKLEKIKDNAFNECKNLTTIKFNDNLKAIGSFAFNSTKIKELNLPKKLEQLGDFAFQDCKNLKDVYFNSSFKEWNRNIFALSNPRFHLTESTLPVEYEIVDNFIIKNKTECFDVIDKTKSSYAIPEGVKVIGNNLFNNCYYLVNITLPNSVEVIEKDAFYRCINLKQITIPDSVTTIGEEAFAECGALTKVVLPDNLEVINVGTFFDCRSLSDINVPSKLKKIKNEAFVNTKEDVKNKLNNLPNVIYEKKIFAHMLTEEDLPL